MPLSLEARNLAAFAVAYAYRVRGKTHFLDEVEGPRVFLGFFDLIKEVFAGYTNQGFVFPTLSLEWAVLISHVIFALQARKRGHSLDLPCEVACHAAAVGRQAYLDLQDPTIQKDLYLIVDEARLVQLQELSDEV